jgi:hypothetical protein
MREAGELHIGKGQKGGYLAVNVCTECWMCINDNRVSVVCTKRQCV